MLVVNKMAISCLETPVIVLALQLLTAACGILAFHVLGYFSLAFDLAKARGFAMVAAAFLFTLYANIKVLQNSNIETFITFRSTTPLVLSVMDYIFLERELPTLRSWLSLFGLLLGSGAYFLADAEFKYEAYGWLFAWYVAFIFDQVYIKHVCDTIPMNTPERVLYQNSMAFLPTLLIIPFTDELHTFTTRMQLIPATILSVSCVLGLAMSHSAFLLRDAVSATSFTVVGILCKIGSVLLNTLVRTEALSAWSYACLMLCILAGAIYQQAPKRVHVPNSDENPTHSPKPSFSASSSVTVA